VDKLKKRGNRNGFKLGGQMEHSTVEAGECRLTELVEGRNLGEI